MNNEQSDKKSMYPQHPKCKGFSSITPTNIHTTSPEKRNRSKVDYHEISDDDSDPHDKQKPNKQINNHNFSNQIPNATDEDENYTINKRNKLYCLRENKAKKRIRFKKKHKRKKKRNLSFEDKDDYEDDFENNINYCFNDTERNETIETMAQCSKSINTLTQEFIMNENKEKENKNIAMIPEKCIPIYADIMKFDFQTLANEQMKAGKRLFDIIVVDPPWQISSQQPSRGVTITYDMLTDETISKLRIDLLQDNGLIFIWAINAKVKSTFELLKVWGYTYCDMLHWVKMTKNGKFAKGHGFYLQHTKETCIIGKKGHPDFQFDMNNCDIILSERRGQSQKPNELYEKIEMLCKDGYYLELFGRRNNLRDHWVTIGNEI